MSDLIRKSDALAVVLLGGSPVGMSNRIAALPAVMPKVKPLVWTEKTSGTSRFPAWKSDAGLIVDSLNIGQFTYCRRKYDTLDAAKAAAQADYEARILAALEPVATPRRYMGQIMAECDCSRQGECEAAQKCLAASDPAAIREALLGTCACGMTGPCMWDQCKHPLAKGTAE